MPLTTTTPVILLFIVTLFAVTVQAVPISATQTALFSSPNAITKAGAGHSTAASLSLADTSDPSRLEHGDPHLNYPKAIPAIQPSHLRERDQIQSLALDRRFSFKSAFHHVEHSVGHTVHSVAHTVGHAAHVVIHNGPAFVKVGLKVAATVGEIAGKVAPFIPGVPSFAGKALIQGSKKLNSASNAIHAHIGGKLGAVMHGMDQAQHIADRVPF